VFANIFRFCIIPHDVPQWYYNQERLYSTLHIPEGESFL